MRLLLALPLSALAMALTVTASAQSMTLSPGRPKLLRDLAPPLTAYPTDQMTDSVTAPNGDRIIVGQSGEGSNYDAFIMRINKRGVSIWSQVVHVGLPTELQKASAVALDASGNIFVAVNRTNDSGLVKYDGFGNPLAISAFAADEVIADLAIASDGSPVAASTNHAEPVTMPHLLVWTDLLASPQAIGVPIQRDGFDPLPPGSLDHVAVVSSGILYFTGNLTNTVGVPRQVIGALSPDFQHVNSRGDIGYGFTQDLKVSSTHNFAVSCGYEDADGEGSLYFGAANYLRATYDASAGQLSLTYDQGGYWPGTVPALDIGPDGSVYTVSNTDYFGGHHTLILEKLIVTFPVSIAWRKYITTPTDDMVASSVIVHGDNVTVVAVDENPTLGPFGPYVAQNLLTFKTSDGSEWHRAILGDSEHPGVVQDFRGIQARQGEYAGGVLSFIAPTADGQTGYWAAADVAGPDDCYTTKKNVPIQQYTLKGSLMENDPNHFVVGQTAAVVPGSATHLSALYINPDGTFFALPEGNYVGDATFQYTTSVGSNTYAQYNVRITINGRNVPPLAVDDNQIYIVKDGGAQTIDVLANDTDPDSHEFSIMSKTNGQGGTVKIAPDGMAVTYKPRRNFTGADFFSYTIKDAGGRTSTAHVYLTVQ